MRTILALCIQDFKRLLTNAFFWILSVTLILLILVINLALPESVAQEGYKLIRFTDAQIALPSQKAQSIEEVEEAVQKDGYIGVIDSAKGLTIVHPQLNDKTLNALTLSLNPAGIIPVSLEFSSNRRPPVPFNKAMLPVFLCFEALVTGCILGGALMLSEKEQGVSKAMRTSPLSIAAYLTAKVLLFSVIGTVYGSLLCIFTVGFAVQWPLFLLLSFFGTAIMTLLGLAYTTLFSDISSWFFSLVLVLSINMLPSMTYYASSFTPFWMKVIPSYPVLFAYSSILFGGSVDIGAVVISLFSWLILTSVFAYLMCRTFFLTRRK